MNDRLRDQLIAALILWLPLCALVLAPLALVLGVIRRTAPRVGAILLAGYLLLAIVTGGYAYTIVPADYTRAHQLTRAPGASALDEQHGAALGYAAERRAFRDEWLTLTVRGLVAPALLLLGWIGWQRRHPALAGVPPECRDAD